MTSSKAARRPTFAVRVCGVEVSNVTTRLVIGSGPSPVRQELIFEDPMVGVLRLDDTLVIEIWRFKGPLARQKWQRTDLRGLYAELILNGAIRRDARSNGSVFSSVRTQIRRRQNSC
jgi:hypothetical protein